MQVLSISVKPQAKRDEVVRTGEGQYSVATTQPAREGKANKQVIKLLARFLNTSPSKLIVTKGERWNDKTILFLD